MRDRQQPVPSLLLRVGGTSALAAGVLFFLTVAYAFGVMPGFGFTQEMSDNRALLLTWVADHAGLYRGLWLLYFASQLFLLPVPLALDALTGQDAGRGFGIAAPCALAGGAAASWRWGRPDCHLHDLRARGASLRGGCPVVARAGRRTPAG